ncbi:MAG: hypothetical protein RL681_47 [Candidatus Parcubacteria bacterium]|jgi:glucose-6-phosphate 1-dehydrogenase
MEEVYKTSNPTILVIFGITGDLARRKLVPALFHLHRKKLLPPLFQVVGFSRREMSDEELRDEVREMMKVQARSDASAVDAFARLFVYRQGMFEHIEGYRALAESLGRKDNEWRVCSNKLFYLAVPPEHYESIFRHVESSGLTEPCSPEEGWTRVVVEKPFGKNTETAERLDILLGKLFREEQIYRIDHYLGKETVQNIIAFRFSNAFLEPAWNRKHIASIAIRMHERNGVESRGAFYDGIGAFRDVGQNHLLQLLALFTMDEPENMTADAVRSARLAALRALKPMTAKEAKNSTRGQYDGYTEAKGVDPRSETETYFRLNAFLRSPRWRGVPILLESGKKMERTFAEVLVTFREAPHGLCSILGDGASARRSMSEEGCANTLRYEMQPDEKITISFWVKKPGSDMTIKKQDFVFDYKALYSPDEFVDPHVDPYRKLLLDAIQGNQTLFVSTGEIKASWKFVDPIFEAWRKNKVPLKRYKPGTLPS